MTLFTTLILDFHLLISTLMTPKFYNPKSVSVTSEKSTFSGLGSDQLAELKIHNKLTRGTPSKRGASLIQDTPKSHKMKRAKIKTNAMQCNVH